MASSGYQRLVNILRSNVLCPCSAEDLGQILRDKSLLSRIKRARRYDRDIGEVLHIIEVSYMISPQFERETDIFVLQVHVGSALTRTPHQTNPFVIAFERAYGAVGK